MNRRGISYAAITPSLFSRDHHMPLVNLAAILRPARQHRYAVGAFNAVNLEFLEAILSAAEHLRSPVILNIAEVHLKYVTLENICPSLLAMAKNAFVPVTLNLDHGLTDTGIRRALKNGFTSIMIDVSNLPFEENIRETRRIVEMCGGANVSVEGELGCVGGDEGSGLVGQADSAFFTDPDQVAGFVKRTGIAALAVAIGNVHGKYKGKPRLDFTRLEQLRDAAGIPLVLHGGSGISEDDFKKAIQLGVAKINFYTGMSQAALAAMEAAMKASGGGYNDYPEINFRVKASVQAVVEQQMRIFGSEGRYRDALNG
jgi:fructose-bisphosphate aldolase class II